MVVKALTPDEAEAKRQKAVEFLRRLGREDDADEFEAMSAEQYAEHKGVELRENPKRRYGNMPRKNSRDLQSELADANDYIAELEDKLDDIAGIASGDEEEDDDAQD